MQKLYALIFCLTILSASYGQQSLSPEQDKRDYNMVSSYNSSTEKWGVWKKTEEVFVLNYNSNGDIARFRPEEEIILYMVSSKIPAEEGETAAGDGYELITAKEGFLTYRFRFFDDPLKGMELHVGTVKLRFAKK